MEYNWLDNKPDSRKVVSGVRLPLPWRETEWGRTWWEGLDPAMYSLSARELLCTVVASSRRCVLPPASRRSRNQCDLVPVIGCRAATAFGLFYAGSKDMQSGDTYPRHGGQLGCRKPTSIRLSTCRIITRYRTNSSAEIKQSRV